jgi:hypothetical protein
MNKNNINLYTLNQEGLTIMDSNDDKLVDFSVKTNSL